MILKPFVTDRLVLRTFRSGDYRLWREACVNSGPPKNRWDEEPKKISDCTVHQFKRLLRRLRKLQRADEYYRLGVFLLGSRTLIGHIDFSIFVRSTHQFANFGYKLHNSYWGQGFGREAARAGLEIGFKQLKLNRLEAAINLDNRRSIRLVKTIGMRREGIKKRYWYENGEWVDHLIYVANPEDLGLQPHRPL